MIFDLFMWLKKAHHNVHISIKAKGDREGMGLPFKGAIIPTNFSLTRIWSGGHSAKEMEKGWL